MPISVIRSPLTKILNIVCQDVCTEHPPPETTFFANSAHLLELSMHKFPYYVNCLIFPLQHYKALTISTIFTGEETI